jgi:uncharacterized small protein (DUF1192 family)
MSELKKYWLLPIEMHERSQHCGDRCLAVYIASDVDARLALKDAEIDKLKTQIRAYEMWQQECGNTEVGCCEQKRRLALMQKTIDSQANTFVTDSLEISTLRRKVQLMQRAIEWCLENGATRGVDDISDSGCGCCSDRIEVPAEFAEIIKGTTHV